MAHIKLEEHLALRGSSELCDYMKIIGQWELIDTERQTKRPSLKSDFYGTVA